MRVFNPTTICTCTVEFNSKGSTTAHHIRYCHLHRAAPDLLAACESIVVCEDSAEWQIIRNRARAAIAKARGGK